MILISYLGQRMKVRSFCTTVVVISMLRRVWRLSRGCGSDRATSSSDDRSYNLCTYLRCRSQPPRPLNGEETMTAASRFIFKFFFLLTRCTPETAITLRARLTKHFMLSDRHGFPLGIIIVFRSRFSAVLV